MSIKSEKLAAVEKKNRKNLSKFNKLNKLEKILSNEAIKVTPIIPRDIFLSASSIWR